MIFLQGNGVSVAYAHRIRKAYGEAAMARVRENPYRLAREVPGIGFQIADRIAQAMGIDRLSPLRMEAGLVFTLENASDSGHCYLPAPELCSRAFVELRIDAGPAEDASGVRRPATGSPPSASSPDAVVDNQRPPRDAAAVKEPLSLLPKAEPAVLLQEGLTSLGLQQTLILEGEDVFTPRLHRAEVTLARRVLELVQRIVVIDAGKVVMDGPKAQVLAALSGARPVPQPAAQAGQGALQLPTNVHRHPSTQPADSKAAV